MAKQQTKKTVPNPVPQNKEGLPKQQDKTKVPFKLEIASLPRLTPYIPGLLLFIASVIISLLVYKDYGLGYDEVIQRLVGITNYEYIFHNDQTLKTIEFRDLGAGFELPLVFIEKLFNLDDSRDIFMTRHLVTNLFFLFSVFCGYVLALRLFKDQYIACLCFILLAFHPRIYAHSYFNTKDIPFLSMFIIVFLLCQVAFEKNKPVWYLLLGFGCGYATSIRAMGILLVPCITLFFLIDFFRSRYLKGDSLKTAKNFAVFIVGFCGLLYLCWPILWSNPIHYFIEEFKSLSHINWDGEVLLAGKSIRSNMLPWYYVPVWFSITMPELWLLLGVAGFGWVIFSFARRPLSFLLNTPDRNYLLYLACFTIPVIAVLALNSINYDDWRHLYFIYPSFVMLVLYVVNKLAVGKKRLIVWGVCALQICLTAFFMIRYHPYQEVYFNNLISHNKEYLRNNYDMDYWSCSFKQGLEYLLDADKSKTISINCSDEMVLKNSIILLPEEDRKRIQFNSYDKADYFITNYRNHPYDFPSYETKFSITVLNSTILSIFKIEKDPAKQKKYAAEEIAILNRFSASNPDDYFAQFQIGLLYYNIGETDSAEVHYKKAITLNNAQISAINNLAYIYRVEKRYPEAIELFKRIVALDPNYQGAQMALGKTYLAAGQYDSAEVHEQMGIDQNPNSDAINDLAGLYFSRKEYRQAIALCKNAIKLKPGDAHPYANIGLCYSNLNMFDSAIVYSKMAISIDPTLGLPYQSLVHIYTTMNKPDSARIYQAVLKQ